MEKSLLAIDTGFTGTSLVPASRGAVLDAFFRRFGGGGAINLIQVRS
jgi:hypothetical protein